MKRLKWHFQQTLSTIGTIGLVGTAFLILAIIVQMGLVQPHNKEVSQLKTSIVRLSSQPQQEQDNKGGDLQAQLGRFYAFFPLRSTLSEQLRVLHEVADSHQLNMGQVDYKLSQVMGTPLIRYQISYKLLTDYPALRHYLADLLIKLPNASLDNIELKRVSDPTKVPEAQFNVSLYLRQEAS